MIDYEHLKANPETFDDSTLERKVERISRELAFVWGLVCELEKRLAKLDGKEHSRFDVVVSS